MLAKRYLIPRVPNLLRLNGRENGFDSRHVPTGGGKGFGQLRAQSGKTRSSETTHTTPGQTPQLALRISLGLGVYLKFDDANGGGGKLESKYASLGTAGGKVGRQYATPGRWDTRT